MYCNENKYLNPMYITFNYNKIIQNNCVYRTHYDNYSPYICMHTNEVQDETCTCAETSDKYVIYIIYMYIYKYI